VNYHSKLICFSALHIIQSWGLKAQIMYFMVKPQPHHHLFNSLDSGQNGWLEGALINSLETGRGVRFCYA